MKWFLRRSYLGRGFLAGTGGVLDSMTMYVTKLGPEHLGRYAQPVDRRIAAAAPSRFTRIRLGDMARLLADALAAPLRDHATRPLHLLNIAGGPGADSWNAILLLRQEHPALLDRRTVIIDLLDIDAQGPLFGARATDALKSPGGPFAGIDLRVRHVPYDWNQPSALASTLAEARAAAALVGVSSEGGLFEYGSDEQITSNLQALAEGSPADSVVVGSVTRAGERADFLPEFKVRPRTREAFEALVQRAGWKSIRVFERPFCYDVALARPRSGESSGRTMTSQAKPASPSPSSSAATH